MRKIIIKLSSEIYIKSKNIKYLLIKKLIININYNLNIFFKNKFFIKNNFFYIELFYKNIKIKNYIFIINILRKMPGIQYILIINEYIFNNLNLKKLYFLIIKNFNILKFYKKTFSININRKGNHNFSSLEIKKYISFRILKNIKSKLNLSKPNIKINLELNNNKLWIINKIYKGINNFPIGTQGNLLSLISGGYDSAISSYLMLKKGCNLIYCYFDFLNSSYLEINKIINIIQYINYLLANDYNYNKLIIINFNSIIDDIIKNINEYKYISILIKYLMLKISKKLIILFKLNGIVVGDSLGQVSSQTIYNLNFLTNMINDLLIIKPLISFDKQTILNISRKLKIYNLCNLIPEYCGFYSHKATAKVNKAKFFLIKKKINKNIINNIIKEIKIINILPYKNNLILKKNNILYLENLDLINIKNFLLVDITTNNFYKNNKNYKQYKIINIPFIKLLSYIIKIKNKIKKFNIVIMCLNKYILDIYANKIYKSGIFNIYKYCKNK